MKHVPAFPMILYIPWISRPEDWLIVLWEGKTWYVRSEDLK